MLTPTNGTPTPSVPTPAPSAKKQRTGQLPTSDVQLAQLATKAAQAWQDSELPALLWLSKADLTAQAAAYAQGRDAADTAGDQRNPQAARLKALDQQLDANIRYVKSYLAEAHDDDQGRAHYPEFGIVRESNTFRLPKARPERVKALGKLLDALKAHKLDKNKFGVAFWQPLATEYAALVAASTDTRGERSAKVSVKDQGEAQVRRALRALIHHIKANHPDTFEARLREFGFQKESY